MKLPGVKPTSNAGETATGQRMQNGSDDIDNNFPKCYYRIISTMEHNVLISVFYIVWYLAEGAIVTKYRHCGLTPS